MTKNKNSLVIGSRASPLAVRQAELVIQKIESLFPNVYDTTIKTLTTSGDKLKEGPLTEVGGKGLFTKELEEALFEGTIDLAVHSVKDMATTLPHGLILAAVLKREDPRDVFISSDGRQLRDLGIGDRVGTCSLRRASQLMKAYPFLDIVPIRGNVQTRLEKMHAQSMAGTLLAHAGLKRLGLEGEATEILDPSFMLPAPGQGVIGIQYKEERHDLLDLLMEMNHKPTMIAIHAERTMLKTLDGSCRTPIGGYATIQKDGLLHLVGYYESSAGRHVTAERVGSIDEPEELGREVGVDLLEQT